MSNHLGAPLSSLRSSRIGDELWHYSKNRRANSDDFKNSKNVILIHGFTASGHYMASIGDVLTSNGCNVFIWNYNSYRGIKKAAEILSDILDNYNELSGGALEDNLASLVCHSMGGLVGRALCQLCSGGVYVSALATLGTPHHGAFIGNQELKAMVRWGEHVSGSIGGFSPSFQSARELVGDDSNLKDDKLIQILSQEAIENLKDIPVLSISGGKEWLEVGKSKFFNRLTNRRIQKSLSGSPNDGLVLELNSDVRNSLSSACEHFNLYPEYLDTNHTHLVNNPKVSLQLLSWLSNEVFSQRESSTLAKE